MTHPAAALPPALGLALAPAAPATAPAARTRGPRRRCLAWLAAAAAGACGRSWAAEAPAHPGASAPAPSTETTDTAALLQQRLQAEGVGLVAAQVGPQGLRYSQAGVQQRGAGAVDADTAFEWGSITKTLTATLLAQQVVAGRITLNDAVHEALPEFDNRRLRLVDSRGEPLRWLDLATHRSGLPRLPDNLVPANPADPYAAYGEADLLAWVSRWKADVPRHTRYAYSNLGAGLLGYALGRVVGTGFEAALQDQVLQPLGLGAVRLRMAGRDALPDTLAQGHDSQGRPVPPWHFQALAGAGAAMGSARLLARWAQCVLGLVDHPLQAALRLATTRQADGPTATAGVGLGWMLSVYQGRTLHSHDGGTFGFSSSLVLDTEARRASAVLANAFVPVNDLALHLLHRSAPLRDRAAERAAQRQAQDEAAQRVVQPVTAEQLAPLAGVYALNPQFKITIRVQGTQLFAQATGQGAFELFASDPRRYFARVTPLEMHFEDSAGPAPALLLLQAGQRLRFVRE